MKDSKERRSGEGVRRILLDGAMPFDVRKIGGASFGKPFFDHAIPFDEPLAFHYCSGNKLR